jgi:cytoskeletal protein RodZ
MEYKKSQFLLEESKSYLNREVEDLEKEKEKLKHDLKYEKNSNILLIIFVIILLVISAIIWFIKI